ncbi:uncharacterized protein LOC8283355 [Ricinus communis]|uniref:Uncharacterized protein n=1 Tax=Ricinus communis TaxID=3988 RepID=B9SGZ3_RICCO|nr:uncharacterized protein LOC8283355 [Ricinus communis]XP_015578528.1 uncharacterized protein LOC8283355 [Ricinus communis]XP_015578529.1 uncharacterized protein LOC8283355 [Ricinus communis]XP_015578530.1 uncharacterized protein LOC8283355 [Ricinus communis]EEF37090.1 conserved hypothetical protein [Ricinus communis]|eukprot:XP_002525262.1 uncharacterized protein LOC8283355 [Ricinus communis]
MDPRYSGETLKHLEKQNELLMHAYNSVSHELHKLQVEEEMLMRKFYQLMAAHGLPKKNEGNAEMKDGRGVGDSTALLTNTSDDSISGENGQATALVPTSSNEQE